MGSAWYKSGEWGIVPVFLVTHPNGVNDDFSPLSGAFFYLVLG